MAKNLDKTNDFILFNFRNATITELGRLVKVMHPKPVHKFVLLQAPKGIMDGSQSQTVVATKVQTGIVNAHCNPAKCR